MGFGQARSGKLKVALVLLILAMLAYLVVPIFPQRDKMNASERTRYKMALLAKQIFRFKQDNHGWPEMGKWEAQLRPYLSREKSFSPGEFLTDSWGHRIRFVVTNKPARLRYLYSFGPNGTDELGAGDDALFEIETSEK